jgi:hypothetical protein
MNQQSRLKCATRNLLIGSGLYYLSWWIANPVTLAYEKLTGGIIYTGDFAGYVPLPLVEAIPYALFAVGVGACVIWLVDSERPLYWAIFPTALYVLFGLMGYHFTRRPLLLDRLEQVVHATFLGMSCFAGALIADHWRMNKEHGGVH